jgi:hypothetical protein
MSPQRIISLVVLLFVLGGLIVAASRSRNSPIPQQPDRLIEQKSAPNEPLKIVAVANKRAKLKIGAKFRDDEEWLKGFTLEVRNSHAKSIKFVSIELLFPRRQGQTEPPVSTTLTYGEDPAGPLGSSAETKLLLPGESVNLRLTDTQHQNLCVILRNEKYDESIGQVRLRLEEVLFGDGTKWLAGMFFRRDGLNPDQWVPIEDTTPKPKLHHPIRSPPHLQLEGKSMDFPAWMVPAKSTNLSLATLACDGHYVSSDGFSVLLLGALLVRMFWKPPAAKY